MLNGGFCHVKPVIIYVGQKSCMVQLNVVIFRIFMAHTVKKILILRQKNLSKQCLLKLFCFSIKISCTKCATKHFKDHSIKLDHAELLYSSII